MSSAQPPDAPPEVEATIARLAAHKHVQGILILARESGIIIRTGGPLFASTTPPSAPSQANKESVDDGEESSALGAAPPPPPPPPPTFGELALSYARSARVLVDSIGAEVGKLEDGDELRFLRLRTKRHELLITPDPLYLLVVVQDPTS
ncbi:hypothetical protein T439DRAFT_325100 [Meredithblackwellia eburnea MCA 4105]